MPLSFYSSLPPTMHLLPGSILKINSKVSHARKFKKQKNNDFIQKKKKKLMKKLIKKRKKNLLDEERNTDPRIKR